MIDDLNRLPSSRHRSRCGKNGARWSHDIAIMWWRVTHHMIKSYDWSLDIMWLRCHVISKTKMQVKYIFSRCIFSLFKYILRVKIYTLWNMLRWRRRQWLFCKIRGLQNLTSALLSESLNTTKLFSTLHRLTKNPFLYHKNELEGLYKTKRLIF